MFRDFVYETLWATWPNSLTGPSYVGVEALVNGELVVRRDDAVVERFAQDGFNAALLCAHAVLDDHTKHPAPPSAPATNLEEVPE